MADEDKVADILLEIGCSEDVEAKFKEEKVDVATVKLLTDDQLKELGVTRIGDRALLRKRCRETEQGERVSREAASVMGSLPTIKYDPSSRSFSSIPRRPKKRSKVGIALSKYAGPCEKKPKVYTFQRKLVVFNYMGVNAPSHFTRKEKYIAMRGLLPDISLDAPEEEVRKEICGVIQSNAEYQVEKCNLKDFEFIDMNGKHASVPIYKPGLAFTGRVVKNLAGSGCVYVRMVSDLFTTFISSDDDNECKSPKSDDDLPPAFDYLPPAFDEPKTSTSFETHSLNQSALDESSTASSFESHSFNQSALEEHSTAGQCIPSSSFSTSWQSSSFASGQVGSSSSSFAPSQLANSSSFVSCNEKPSGECSTSSPSLTHVSGHRHFSDNINDGVNVKNVEQLYEMFPNLEPKSIDFVFKNSGGDSTNTMNCLLGGPSLESIRKMLKSCLITTLGSDSPRIRIQADDDEEDWANIAIAFYKSQFDPSAAVRVSIKGQPGIDAGGVRRHFFFKVYKTILYSTVFKLFEGQGSRLRPVFRTSNLSSGLLTMLGKMIGHNLVLDGQTFPYLSECIYYYLAGKSDTAITKISDPDVSEQIKSLKKQVEELGSNEELKEYNRKEELMDIIEQSGMECPLELKNIPKIFQTIMIYDALHKRKIFLDAFAEGLQVFGLAEFIRMFPEVMKPAFVDKGDVTPDQLLAIVKPHFSTNEAEKKEEEKVFDFFKEFVRQLSDKGLKSLSHYATGMPTLSGNCIVINFDKEDISANTCGREIKLPTQISSKEALFHHLTVLINEDNFTMS